MPEQAIHNSGEQQKIMPCLWFEQGAAEAAAWYAGLFGDSAVHDVDVIHDTPAGDTETVSFRLAGLEFSAIGAEADFTFTPAISFWASCPDPDTLDGFATVLSQRGGTREPLAVHSHGGAAATVRDRFGLYWHLVYAPNGQDWVSIRPCLLFSGETSGYAEDALAFYE